MATSYEAAVATLYRAPPEQFVDERKRLASALKAEGDKANAARLAKLPRPTLSVWAVNQLWQRERDLFEQLFASAERLRRGDLGGTSAHRDALAQLRVHAARVLVEGGHPSTEATLRRVSATLAALAAAGSFEPDPPGALSADRDPPGFDDAALSLAAWTSSAPAPEPRVMPGPRPATGPRPPASSSAQAPAAPELLERPGRETTQPQQRTERDDQETRKRAERDAVQARQRAKREGAAARARAEREAVEVQKRAERDAAEARARAERDAVEAQKRAQRELEQRRREEQRLAKRAERERLQGALIAAQHQAELAERTYERLRRELAEAELAAEQTRTHVNELTARLRSPELD